MSLASLAPMTTEAADRFRARLEGASCRRASGKLLQTAARWPTISTEDSRSFRPLLLWRSHLLGAGHPPHIDREYSLHRLCLVRSEKVADTAAFVTCLDASNASFSLVPTCVTQRNSYSMTCFVDSVIQGMH